MKKILLILLCLPLLFTSCSKDDDNSDSGNVNETSILGVWSLKHLEWSYYRISTGGAGNSIGDTLEIDIGEADITDDLDLYNLDAEHPFGFYRWEFLDDGEGRTHYYIESTDCIGAQPVLVTGYFDWYIQGDELFLVDTEGNQTIQIDIISLNNDELEITFSYEGEELYELNTGTGDYLYERID